MKVAFDVKGTLQGPHSDKVLKLLKWFQAQGAEVTVWSNDSRAAMEVGEELVVAWSSKQTKWDLDTCVDPESYYYDYAIDDDSQQDYLAAKKFIWVKDIPDDEKEFENLLR